MLAECDVVSVHAVVTPETEGLMGAAQFAAMKPGSMYINSARAMLHDTDALVAALQSGHLGGAGLDHFKGENLPIDHPLHDDERTSCSRRTSAARRTTPKRTTRSSSPTTWPASSHGEKPVNCVNPEVLA